LRLALCVWRGRAEDAVWISTVGSTVLYALIGIMGAAAYERAEVRLPPASSSPRTRLRFRLAAV